MRLFFFLFCTISSYYLRFQFIFKVWFHAFSECFTMKCVHFKFDAFKTVLITCMTISLRAISLCIIFLLWLLNLTSIFLENVRIRRKCAKFNIGSKLNLRRNSTFIIESVLSNQCQRHNTRRMAAADNIVAIINMLL